MKIIITIANDTSLNDANKLMKELNNEVLYNEKHKSIIKDVKITE